MRGLSFGLIVGERHRRQILDCRVGLRPSGAFVLAIERRTSSIAVDIDFEDRGVMDEPIHGGERHGGVWEDLAPGAERLIGCNQRWNGVRSGR